MKRRILRTYVILFSLLCIMAVSGPVSAAAGPSNCFVDPAWLEEVSNPLITDEIRTYVEDVFESVTDESMDPEEKLWAVFSHLADREEYPYIQKRIPHYTEEDWPVVYADDMIEDGGSTCQGLSSILGYEAKLCGFSDVYWCANRYHAWVDIDGKIYDPVFRDSTFHTLVYGWTYDQGSENDWLGAGYEETSAYDGTYMHLKVPEI